MNVSISLQLNKNDVETFPIEISSKKERASKMDFSTIKIKSKKVSGNTVDISARESTSKKVCGNNVDFSTIEITSKKVHGNKVDFSTSKIMPKKVRGNDVDILISEITLKKYVEMMWKFVEMWSSTYRRKMHVELTSIRRGVPVGLRLVLKYPNF